MANNCIHKINLNNPFRVFMELRQSNTVNGIRLEFFTDDQGTAMDFTGWVLETNFFDIEVELPNVLILSATAKKMNVALGDYNLDIKGTLNSKEQTIVAGRYEVKKDYLTSGCVQDGSTINLQYFNVIERIVIEGGWLPYFAVVDNGIGKTMQLAGWFGGEGDEPTQYIGWYIGEDGYVEDIADAVIFGEKGDTGKQVEIGNNGTAIVWRYVGDTVWIPIVSLEDLSFKYSDFTPEQILLLQQPALDAADIANEATLNANNAADNANSKATIAQTAATNANNAAIYANDQGDITKQIGIDTEQVRVDTLVVKNEAITATQNANQATSDANTATGLANTATSNANTATSNAVIATNNANNAADNANGAFNMFKNYVNYIFGITQPELSDAINRSFNEGFKLPNQLHLLALDTLIYDLKQANVWNVLDMVPNYGYNQSGLEGFRRINLRNPTSDLALFYGGLEFSPEFGVKGNATDAYIDTVSNLSVAENYNLNSACRIVILSKTGVIKPASWMLSTNPSRDYIGANTFNTQRLNSGTNNLSGGSIDLTGIGLKAITRNNATTVELYNKGVRSVYGSISTIVEPSSDKLLAQTPSSNFDVGILFYARGGYINEVGIANMRLAYNKYLTTIGLTAIA